MAKESLKKRVHDIITSPFILDKHVKELLAEEVFKEYGDDATTLFMKFQELQRKKEKEANMILYHGLQDALHNLVGIGKPLLEDKTSRKAKAMTEILFKEGNIAYLINIMKAYFPSGKVGGASSNGAWLFDSFESLLVKNRTKYEKGGDSEDWARLMNHTDYIELILKNYDKRTTKEGSRS